MCASLVCACVCVALVCNPYIKAVTVCVYVCVRVFVCVRAY